MRKVADGKVSFLDRERCFSVNLALFSMNSGLPA
jgi:3'-phosphoadenosine 5'-phosphosulfate (PAPS) 3'-phosphatase